MRLIPRALMQLAASVAKAVRQEKEKTETVVDLFPAAQRQMRSGGSRRDTYYWPGRRAAAALRTAGKTRRMR